MDTNDISHRTRPRRRLLAVGLTTVAVGLAGASVASAGSENDRPDIHVPSAELVRYSTEHGLSGLSPASLHPTAADAIELARQNDLTGLSPEGLLPTATAP